MTAIRLATTHKQAMVIPAIGPPLRDPLVSVMAMLFTPPPPRLEFVAFEAVAFTCVGKSTAVAVEVSDTVGVRVPVGEAVYVAVRDVVEVPVELPVEVDVAVAERVLVEDAVLELVDVAVAVVERVMRVGMHTVHELSESAIIALFRHKNPAATACEGPHDPPAVHDTVASPHGDTYCTAGGVQPACSEYTKSPPPAITTRPLLLTGAGTHLTGGPSADLRRGANAHRGGVSGRGAGLGNNGHRDAWVGSAVRARGRGRARKRGGGGGGRRVARSGRRDDIDTRSCDADLQRGHRKALCAGHTQTPLRLHPPAGTQRSRSMPRPRRQ